MNITRKFLTVSSSAMLRIVESRLYKKYLQLGERMYSHVLPATGETLSDSKLHAIRVLREVKNYGRVSEETKRAGNELHQQILGAMDVDLHNLATKAEQIKHILKY